MKTFFKWLILAPVCVIVIIFAVVNRAQTTVVFDPFGSVNSGLAVTAPLFVALFVAVMIGVVLGGCAVWIEQGRHRRAARESRVSLARLRAEQAQQSDNGSTLPARVDRSAA